MSRADIAQLARDILSSAKYADADLCADTVIDLLEREIPLYRSQKDAVKAVRKKLHNIVAPYLGDPDYAGLGRELEEAVPAGRTREVCARILASHASTNERLSILAEFYPRLFALTGPPASILDLACGLNPFSLPWMDLAPTVEYRAYDIHRPRVGLINHFLGLLGRPPLAEVRDILVSPPETRADLAFFFKEAHRFEQRQHGCNRAFWLALPVRWLLVSLPPTGLTGRSSLVEGQRRLVHQTIAGLDWPVTEIAFQNELVFCIDKSGAAG
jgi:16S rRNA (guanine(1405)-N(7))-methyltransferase